MRIPAVTGVDFQIWCGPAIGAFNQWTKGSILERPENRECVSVAQNLLVGAAVTLRANWIRLQGVALPSGVEKYSPQTRATMAGLLAENASSDK